MEPPVAQFGAMGVSPTAPVRLDRAPTPEEVLEFGEPTNGAGRRRRLRAAELQLLRRAAGPAAAAASAFRSAISRAGDLTDTLGGLSAHATPSK
jgi:hypothetical protein